MLTATVRGISDIHAKLEAYKRREVRALRTGIQKAALAVQRDAQIMTPVDVGFLRASAQTVPMGPDKQPFSRVSFTASYALFVHENLTAAHKTGEAKFLEKAVDKNRTKIKGIVSSEVRKARQHYTAEQLRVERAEREDVRRRKKRRGRRGGK